MAQGGSRFLKEPFDCRHEPRFDAVERVMEVQFEGMDKRLERIESMMTGLEKRLWMTVYGVVAVILTQAVQGVMDYVPR